jgi:hypothetical protein
MNGSSDGCFGAGVQIETSRDTCGLLGDGVLVLRLPWGVGARCGGVQLKLRVRVINQENDNQC